MERNISNKSHSSEASGSSSKNGAVSSSSGNNSSQNSTPGGSSLDRNANFQETLWELLTRLLLNYPFEATPVLLLHKNAELIVHTKRSQQRKLQLNAGTSFTKVPQAVQEIFNEARRRAAALVVGDAKRSNAFLSMMSKWRAEKLSTIAPIVPQGQGVNNNKLLLSGASSGQQQPSGGSASSMNSLAPQINFELGTSRGKNIISGPNSMDHAHGVLDQELPGGSFSSGAGTTSSSLNPIVGALRNLLGKAATAKNKTSPPDHESGSSNSSSESCDEQDGSGNIENLLFKLLELYQQKKSDSSVGRREWQDQLDFFRTEHNFSDVRNLSHFFVFPKKSKAVEHRKLEKYVFDARKAKQLPVKATKADCKETALSHRVTALEKIFSWCIELCHELPPHPNGIDWKDEKRVMPITKSAVQAETHKQCKQWATWWPSLTAYSDIHYQYREADLLTGWSDTFQMVGSGVSVPRSIIVVAESGKAYKLLVKGDDDARQDCIFEQIFMHLKSVAGRAAPGGGGKTNKNVFEHLVTYKVIPLAPQQAVIEWVDPTMPVGSWLQDAGGGHARYNPQDWANARCRAVMNEGHFTGFVQDPALRDKKIAAFRKCCENFQPALKYFFLEKFGHNAVKHHEALTAYAKSLAVTSMVGYVLGVGDRHVNNIMMNLKTGEILHIDFGMVFDFAKNLPVPEEVPFRMTRDLVHPLGWQGLQNGVFRKGCEYAFELLQQHEELLLNLCEVFLYDPITRWNARQECETAAGGEQALQSIRSKLSLTDCHSKSGLSQFKDVPAFLDYLLTKATDPVNQAVMFAGWSSWC
ncbi:unnamed protein product [Amoebophrya sp. A120]|nr:unnamed protein product [Amoebophrya sp. A120]|eukprot:GSA120T00024825001.1